MPWEMYSEFETVLSLSDMQHVSKVVTCQEMVAEVFCREGLLGNESYRSQVLERKVFSEL